MRVCYSPWIGEVDKGVDLDALCYLVVGCKHQGRESRYLLGGRRRAH